MLKEVRGELEKQTELLRQVLEDKEKESVTPRTKSIRRRKRQYVSIVTPTPFWKNSEAPLLKAWTIAFVKSKLLFQT